MNSRQFSEFCSFYVARMASFEWRFPTNLVPRVLSYPHYQAHERETDRETLENAGHVAPEQNYF